MSIPFSLFKFVVKSSLNGAGMGFAADLFGESLPEVAKSVYDWWVRGRKASEVRAAVAAVAAVGDDEARRLAARAVAEEAAGRSEDVQLQLISYLSQIPAAVRQTQRRPADPSGRSVAMSLTLRTPADVLALLPGGPPRFRKGQHAPGFADWTLDELLGVGGFGEVWKATNPHLPPVALKFCLDPAAARTLRNEADLLGRVVSHGRHPGIVALLNTSLSTDPPCLMYEYVPGGDLAGLARHWADDERIARSLEVMRALADAVAFAHSSEPPIVHRDLKPGNVLLAVGQAFQPDTRHAGALEAHGRRVRLESLTYNPKIADFGIGGLAATPTARTLPTAQASCTPLYASPQQLRGDDPDPRDDVFALGVIWYQLLTGDLTERPGADWREELPEVSDEILAVLGRCLAARAERRLADGAALAEALANLRPAAVEPPAIEDFDEDEEESDNPLDVAGRLQRSLAIAQKALTRAVEMSERRHDYASAVRLLEGLPEAFRDNAFLDHVRARRDRAAELLASIRAAARGHAFAGLRDQIEEYLEIQPEDAEARRLLRVVPWEPGAVVMNSVQMRLMLIPAGTFRMGSPAGEFGRSSDEGPTHAVEIRQRFYIGAHPVTQEQYRQVMGANPSHFRCVPGQDWRTFPVENVSHHDALAFCRALSGSPSERRLGRTYRLPTEAEWEYASRAGQNEQVFSFGRTLSSTQANFDGRRPYGYASRGDFLARTTAVGSYPANEWGLFDMHGNVWEWCSDWYEEGYYRTSPRANPPGPKAGTERVLRGGSWQNHGRLCRSACRDRAGVSYRSLNAGVRVVMEVRKG